MMPTRRLLLLLAAWLLAALLIPFTAGQYPALPSAWWALFALATLVAGADALRAWRLPVPEVQRRLPGSLALGVEEKIGLRLSQTGKPLTLDLYDHHPASMQARDLPVTLTLPAEGFVEHRYRVTPLQRGELAFPLIQLRLHSPWGLWRRNIRLPRDETLRVYPNFAAVAKYTLLAADNRLSQMGIRKQRRRGEGQDFHQLREYRDGDPLRQIDWKASSRLRKLISREYQEERDQEIIFLLDCGYRMLARDSELSHFDHSLNAILLLAWVALRQGDGVGFGSFSGNERWLRPVKGSTRINHLFNTLYDLQPTTEVPDYAEAATRLLVRQKKRALVVLLTNLRDEDNTELIPAIRLLRQRHLVLVASMREQALDQTLEQPIDDFEQALRHAATRDYLLQREQAVGQIRNTGVLCLDVNPQNLSVSLVNQYLDIKASGLL